MIVANGCACSTGRDAEGNEEEQLTRVLDRFMHVLHKSVWNTRCDELTCLHATDDRVKIVDWSFGVRARAVVVAEMPALVAVAGFGRECARFLNSVGEELMLCGKRG